MNPRPMIAAVVLAAGQSTRAGPANKLLSPVRGRAMVHAVVDLLSLADVFPIVVVTGHQRAAVQDALFDAAVTFAHNPDYEKGMSRSIAAGIGALPEEVDGALVCLGDMPHITRRTVQNLVANHGDDCIRIPVNDGKRGHPVMFPRRYFADLRELHGDVGARPVILGNPDQVIEVPVEDGGIFIDHDVV